MPDVEYLTIDSLDAYPAEDAVDDECVVAKYCLLQHTDAASGTFCSLPL